MSPRIKGEKSATYDFKNAAMDLSTSAHLVAPDHALRLLNFDLSRERGALVGRRGSKVINASHGLPGAIKDVYVCDNPDGAAGHTRYMIISYVWDGVHLELAVANISNGLSEDYAFYPLRVVTTGAQASFTANSRFSFCSIYWPFVASVGPDKQIILITNGVDQMYYWDMTDTIEYVFVATGSVAQLKTFRCGLADVKLEGFLSTAWRGRAWGWKGNTEYFASADNPTLWDDDDTTAGCLEAPMEQYQNPIRGNYIVSNNLTLINRDTIGHVYATGSDVEPFIYSQDHEGSGTFNHRTVLPWKDNLVFFDRRPPYLFRWNGTSLFSLDPQNNMVAGIQRYLDIADIPNIRMAIGYDTLLIAMGIVGGTTRMLARVNLTRTDANGYQSYPWTLDDIQANDVISNDRGNYTGQVYVADKTMYPATNGKYYLLRLYDFMDTTLPAPYGDYNGILVNQQPVGVPITYQWRSGWLNLGTKDFKSLLTFFLRARWEGTPDPATDTLTIGYKIDTWTNFETLKPKEILEYDEIPFPAFAYGREVQIQLTYVTKTSIPIVDEFGFTFRPYPAVRD